MDDQNNHGFMPVDLTYDDDLLNSTGWSTTGNPQFHYAQSSQDQYTSFQGPLHIGQPSYDHFSINPQSAFNTLSYDNSPYGEQFQRSSDVSTPSFSIDFSIANPQNYHAHNRSFALAPQSNENATISPQTLQYNINNTQETGNNDPNLGFKPATNGLSNEISQSQENPIYYSNPGNLENLRNTPSNYSNITSSIQETSNLQSSSQIKNESLLAPASLQVFRPKSNQSPKTVLRITHPELYEAKNTSSRPRFDYAPFVAWEDTPIKITVGLKNTLPKYHARKSRSGKDLIPGFDVCKSLSPAQISTRKHNRAQSVKDPNSSLNRYKGTSQKPRILTSKTKAVLEDGNSKAIKSQIESSSSEDETSSESESEYDEEIPIVDVSEIRGATRPSELSQAARWDTIGLIWRDPNSNPNADSVKDAIEKYANFVIALRMKIKTNSTQIEAQLRQSETAKLQVERRVLLECLYQTISTASEFGYGPIIENLGGHHKLVNGLTTTLIECIKADDFTGKLPKAVFELLAKFKTLTDDLLRKLKFDSIQKRWNKKGDEQTKKIISSILSNTLDAKERPAKAKKDVEEKKIRDKDGQAKTKAFEASNSTNSNPNKRPHEGSTSDGKPSKKTVSDMTSSAAIARSLIPKRGSSNLLGISTKPIVKAAPKKHDPSPPSESKLGALLASIAKDPEPPRIPDAPTRAPETQQEKAKRERKESRRHLRVKFKEGSELEEIRLFKHEQAEDEGRQDEMLRDAHDDRLEGMMHKKRVTEAIDDDEDYQPSEADPPYPEPSLINLGSLEKTSRFGKTYSTRGGSLNITSSEVLKQEKRESLELMVIYTNPADIPLSPREPSSLSNGGVTQSEPILKGPNVPWLVQRLEDINRYGPEHALSIFLLQSKSLASRQSSTSEILSVLQQLSGVSPQPVSRPPESQIDSAALTTLYSWAKYLSGKPYPATEPPEWMSPGAKIEWLEGYNKDMASKNNFVGPIGGPAQPNQMPSLAPSMMNMASYQQAFPPSQSLPQAIYPSSVSEFSQQSQGYITSYPSRENHLGAPQSLDYSGWTTQITKSHNDNHLSVSQDLSQRWDSERDNENTRGNHYDVSKVGIIQRGYEQQFFDPKSKYNSLFDENGEYKGKKKPCRFWAEGKCAKGSKCTFLHTSIINAGQ